MKKVLIQKLILWITVAGLLSAGILLTLMDYNRAGSASSASQLGAMYMSEMMFQVKDHFETIVEIKNNEMTLLGGMERLTNPEEQREVLQAVAQSLDFEYLALYDESGNGETILGEEAWYRKLNAFISGVHEGRGMATTGYLTRSGGKYIVFGVPAEYPMQSGETSSVLLAGFSIERLYDYIRLDELEQMGKNAEVEIILTNGSYVLKRDTVAENSFFDHINRFGSFNGMENQEGITLIENSMAYGDNFSSMVSLEGRTKHLYGAPAGVPEDWYFIISMPQGVTDQIIRNQNAAVSHAFLGAGAVIILMFFGIFLIYLRMSEEQIRQTEAARAEAEQARADAETANRAKSTFLSNMSHDIRTPMNAIVGYASIVESGITSGDHTRALDALEKMKRSSDYLRSLISDVLDMSKIEVGVLDLAPETISLKQMAGTVVSIANTHTAARQQTFEVNVHEPLHDMIHCDRTRMQQILINLLSNAMKFTPEGGTVGLEIWQEPSEKGDAFVRTCFVVSDNGIGMSPEFVKTMFDSFTREESKVRKIEGTGLGLAITKSLVDMMEGSIRTESEEGKGSHFFVTVDFEKAEIEMPEEILPPEAIQANGLRILLAEDNDFNYDIAQFLLQANGFVAERAENGQVAVEKYREDPSGWSMILMDLRMPVLNGYQATEKIRRFEALHPDRPHIPIYALSADVFAEDIEQCMRVGMDGHIAKPIDMDELFQVLQRHTAVHGDETTEQ